MPWVSYNINSTAVIIYIKKIAFQDRSRCQ
uniref:Uncharacterized protein n=1 Tax=Anguilla anguilla TaxID=7936 RepID=A0A0E9Q0X3_ANGAN